MMIFADRTEAGRELAPFLTSYKPEHPIVYALPRGGVAVAAEVARVLAAPLELLLVRKIGVPWQPELAMGALVDGGSPVIVRNAEVLSMVSVSEKQFDEVCRRELAEVERRRRRYMSDRAWLDPKGRVAIVIDDGIATGSTMTAALRAMRQHQPKKLVLAVPVAPRETVEKLRGEADDVICPVAPDDFGAIGFFYRNFRQLSDEDVISLLDRAAMDASRE
jgi:predicted phosphoribosyltransferase